MPWPPPPPANSNIPHPSHPTSHLGKSGSAHVLTETNKLATYNAVNAVKSIFRANSKEMQLTERSCLSLY